MSLTPELRARMARDMQSNRKFDGDTDIPAECKAFSALSDVETVERPAVCGFPYKIYVHTAKNKKPGSPVHVNIHGGGWLIPHMPNDTLWSAWLADQIEGVVVDVDYTTTEFASFPVPLEQCLDAARYAFAHLAEWGCDPKKVSMGGYSAGGQLTMAVAVAARMRKEELPFCLLLNGYGPNDMRYDPKATEIPEYWKTQQYRGVGFSVLMGDENAELMEDPTIDFMNAPDDILATLPSTMILGAANDPFHLQNLEQARKLANLGVETTCKIYPDTFHGFIPHFMKHWDEAGDFIVRMIRATSL